MTDLIIDASLASAWCCPMSGTVTATGFFSLFLLRWRLLPNLWTYEVRNGILMGLRRGRLSKTEEHGLTSRKSPRVSDQILHVRVRVSVFFILDCDQASKIDPLQFLHHAGSVHDSFSEQHIMFGARALHVFEMYQQQTRSQTADGFERVVTAGCHLAHIQRRSDGFRKPRQRAENVVHALIRKLLLEPVVVNTEGQTFFGKLPIDTMKN